MASADQFFFISDSELRITWKFLKQRGAALMCLGLRTIVFHFLFEFEAQKSDFEATLRESNVKKTVLQSKPKAQQNLVLKILDRLVLYIYITKPELSELVRTFEITFSRCVMNLENYSRKFDFLMQFRIELRKFTIS